MKDKNYIDNITTHMPVLMQWHKRLLKRCNSGTALSLVGLLFLFFLVLYWLNGHIILFDDGYFPFNPRLAILTNVGVWNYYNFPGAPYYVSVFYLPFTIFVYLGSIILGLPFWLSQSLYIYVLLGIGFYGMFKFTGTLIRDFSSVSIGSNSLFFFSLLPGSFYYIFNYYQMFSYGSEFYPTLILLDLFPLYLYFFTKYISNGKIFDINLILAGIIAMLMAGGYYEFPFILWEGFILLIFCSAYILIGEGGERKKRIIKSLIFYITEFMVSLWVLLPVIYNSQSAFVTHINTITSGQNLFSYIYSYNSPLQILKTIMLEFGPGLPSHGTIAFPASAIQEAPALLWLSAIPFILSIVSLLFYRKNKLIIPLFLINFLLIFLTSKIINLSPLLNSNNILLDGIIFSFTTEYNGIPAFVSFPIMLLTGILSSFSLVFLTKKLRDSYLCLYNPEIMPSRKNRPERGLTSKRFTNRSRFAVYSVIIAVVFALYFASFTPVIDNPSANYNDPSGVTISSKVTVQPQFLDLIHYLSGASENDNILVLPILPGESSSFNGSQKYWSVYEPISGGTLGTVIYRDRGFNSSWMSYPILKYFPYVLPKNLTAYLDVLGIKTIVVDTSAFGGSGNPSHSQFSGVAPYNFSIYLSALNNTPGINLSLVDFPYYVYQISYNVPIIYGSASMLDILRTTPLYVYQNYSSENITPIKDVIIQSFNGKFSNSSGSGLPKISYLEYSNSRYSVSIHSNTPFFLTLDESYNNLWVLQFSNSTIDNQHYLANAYANSWLMPSGNYSVIIYVSTEQTQSILEILPIITISFIASVVVFRKLRVKVDL